MTISEEKRNLFEYAGYSMIGVMLGYSASNLVALVKIIYIGYNQFYRNSQERDAMFTERSDL